VGFIRLLSPATPHFPCGGYVETDHPLRLQLHNKTRPSNLDCVPELPGLLLLEKELISISGISYM